MITLADITAEHRESMTSLLNNENVSKWLLSVPFPYSLEDADRFISECVNSGNDYTVRRYAIDKDGVHVGGIGLHKRYEHEAEVGYWVGQPYWNKGIAAEALRQIIEIGFEEMKLQRIFGLAFEGNQQSERVMIKCGFQYEGFLRKARIKDGKAVNCRIFAIVK